VQRELRAARGVQRFVGEPLSIQGAQILSGWAHVAVLAALALVSHRMPENEPDAESIEDRIALMRRLLAAGADATGTSPGAPAATIGIEADATPSDVERPSDASTRVGERGRDTRSGRGAPGRRTSGDSRHAALGEAMHFGVLGALAGAGRPSSQASRWSTPDTEGVGGAAGFFYASGSDLGLSGLGEGSGEGTGNGISLGAIGALGHDAGSVDGMAGWGRLGGHQVRGPAICGCDEGFVNARLPPEAIQRVVRQNMGRFRYCYERGLARNPSLQGRVATRFVIARDGTVSFASRDEPDTDFADPAVVACIVRAFGALSFPQPETGTVDVVYPLTLTPSG
jgi:hypothetical protein